MATLIGVAGDLLENITVSPSTPSTPSTDCEVTPAHIIYLPGGNAAIFAQSVTAVGGSARVLTRIGSDERADWLIGQLTRSGIEVMAQRGSCNDTVVTVVDIDGAHTVLQDRSTARSVETFDLAWLDGLAWLHVSLRNFETAHEAQTFSALCVAAAARGIPVSVDTSSLGIVNGLGTGRVLELLALLKPQLIFANEEVAHALALYTLTPAENSCWVLKHGANPLMLRTATEQFYVEVPSGLELTNTARSANNFAAGMLRSLVAGDELVDAARNGIEALYYAPLIAGDYCD